jgi:hypothetical protein
LLVSPHDKRCAADLYHAQSVSFTGFYEDCHRQCVTISISIPSVSVDLPMQGRTSPAQLLKRACGVDCRKTSAYTTPINVHGGVLQSVAADGGVLQRGTYLTLKTSAKKGVTCSSGLGQLLRHQLIGLLKAEPAAFLWLEKGSPCIAIRVSGGVGNADTGAAQQQAERAVRAARRLSQAEFDGLDAGALSGRVLDKRPLFDEVSDSAIRICPASMATLVFRGCAWLCASARAQVHARARAPLAARMPATCARPHRMHLLPSPAACHLCL